MWSQHNICKKCFIHYNVRLVTRCDWFKSCCGDRFWGCGDKLWGQVVWGQVKSHEKCADAIVLQNSTTTTGGLIERKHLKSKGYLT